MTEADALQFVRLLLKDMRQLMNTPWYAQQALRAGIPIDEHEVSGPNFVAAGCLMSAIEWVGKLATAEEKDTAAAVSFLRSYFPADYGTRAQLIWDVFRHGRIHKYLPQWVHCGQLHVGGQVLWVSPLMRIETLEAAIKTDRASFFAAQQPNEHLGLEPLPGLSHHYVLKSSPQIGFADFSAAVDT